jgi:hypothetical protein
MPTTVKVNEALSSQDRTRGLAKSGTRDMFGLLIAVALVFLVVGGAVYLSSLVGPAEVEDVGQFFAGP